MGLPRFNLLPPSSHLIALDVDREHLLERPHAVGPARDEPLELAWIDAAHWKGELRAPQIGISVVESPGSMRTIYTLNDRGGHGPDC